MKKLICILTFALAGCASTQYKPYEAVKNDFVGSGGTKVVVNGVDMWDNGDPPRRFKVLGIIEDERPGGIIPMARMQGDIATKAKEAGGDAVVVLNNRSVITGYYSTGSATAYSSGNTVNAFGSGVSTGMRKNVSKYAVIKYLN